MLISLNWLNELLPGDAPLDAKEVETTLTSLGLEVEGVSRHGHDLGAIIVGELRSIEPHPKADRLNVTTVFDGAEEITVVCGASNLPGVGGKIAFAPVGTTLPGGLTLDARDLRGVPSHGMICSEEELEIGGDTSGILVLPGDWKAGERLIDRVGTIVDTVIEISVTPNRPDALGHRGVARDLALALGRSLREPDTFARADLGAVTVDDAMVSIDAPQRCGRYHGYGLDSVRVGPSPLWMRVRLHRVGLRPLSNVVDITNVVLMEYGQPLHGFDRDKLAEGRVVVRTATAAEGLVTIDDSKIALGEDDLVIADANEPQALAGVMGGSASMVGDDTTRVLLEAAWFDPGGVRASARRHGFHTDSSHRFERGVDYDAGLDGAARRALRLMVDLCGATVSTQCTAHGACPPEREIEFRPQSVLTLLGIDVPVDRTKRIFEGLEIATDDASVPWTCRAPSFRPDLVLEVDLVEEVMRHYGLEHLPAKASPPSQPPSVVERGAEAEIGDALVTAMAGLGLHEHVGFAFGDPGPMTDLLGPQGADGLVMVRNPMRSQQSAMRTHMLPGLLEALNLNLSRHNRPVKLFERGRIYRWETREGGQEGPTAQLDGTLPRERGRVGMIVARIGAGAAERAGAQLVGWVLSALTGLGYRARAVGLDRAPAHLHPGVCAGLVVEHDGVQVVVGEVGEVHPDWAPDLPVGSRPHYAELWLECLAPLGPPLHRAIPRFPATNRDVSIEIERTVPASAIVAALIEARDAVQQPAGGGGEDPVMLGVGDDSSHAITLVEDYRGDNVGADRKALLLRLSYRAQARSITDDEVQALHDGIVAKAIAILEARGLPVSVR